MTATEQTALSFQRGVEAGILDAVRELQQSSIQRAVDQFERELRARIAIGAMQVQSMYSMERRGTDLLISVKIEDAR